MDILVISVLLAFASAITPPYLTSCSESLTRVCPYGTNVSDYLLQVKKGPSSPLSTLNYLDYFFLCEQYDYSCGYMQEVSGYIFLANGVPLNMSQAKLASLVPDPTLSNNIAHYLNLTGLQAFYVLKAFPLTLTDAQTESFFQAYMGDFAFMVSMDYSIKRKIYSQTWANINVNIKTAVLQTAKMQSDFTTSTFRNNLLRNNFSAMSAELKGNYNLTNGTAWLRSAYLIDSVTSVCNKYQSISFLVDQSNTIGSISFQNVLTFLKLYVRNTNDDLSIMQIHFFDSSFESLIGFNTDLPTMLTKLAAKTYRARTPVNIGLAINATIARILANGFLKGVPQIIALVTHSASVDNVVDAGKYAMSLGISIVCISFGAGTNNAQLLQLANTQSNIINVPNSSSLSSLTGLLSNFFCKQHIDVRLSSIVPKNVVRVETSPSYFRVEKSSTQTYQLVISYQTDPEVSGELLIESFVDPFPDVYSAKSESVTYRTDVLTRKMFLGPTTVETVAVKKGITVNVTPTVSYISWSASNLQFNLSLQPCSTIDCHDEIALCEQISSLSYSRNGSKPNVAVYITIAASLITLAICSVLTLYIFNKYFLATLESPEHIQTRTEKISQAEHSFPETHANNVPTNRGDFSTSKLPTKRQSTRKLQQSSRSRK